MGLGRGMKTLKLREKVQKAFSRQMLNMQMSGSVKRKVKRYLENHFREEEGKKKRTGIEMATSA